MNVSLDQAIEMHAKALKTRSGPRAARAARDKAERCGLTGDRDGLVIWLKVAEAAEALPSPNGAAQNRH